MSFVCAGDSREHQEWGVTSTPWFQGRRYSASISRHLADVCAYHKRLRVLPIQHAIVCSSAMSISRLLTIGGSSAAGVCGVRLL